MSESKAFFTTLPGILTGLAAVLTAVAGLLYALHETGFLGSSVSNAAPAKSVAPDRPAAAQPKPLAGDTTDGWAIIGSSRRGDYYDLNLVIDGESPAPGRRYSVVNDFRLVAADPREKRTGQTITLGMVRRGDTVELLDLYVPSPSTRTVPVWAKLRAVLDRVGR